MTQTSIHYRYIIHTDKQYAYIIEDIVLKRVKSHGF